MKTYLQSLYYYLTHSGQTKKLNTFFLIAINCESLLLECKINTICFMDFKLTTAPHC